MKKAFSYVAGGLVLLVIWVFSGQIGQFIGRSAVESYNQGRQQGGVQRALELAADELRKQLPMRLNENTVLHAVASSGNTLMYYYNLSYNKGDLNINDFHATMRKNLVSNVCQQQDMRYTMGLGGKYKYVYMSADGLLIDEITIGASDC